eukprot:TRINITY_DN49784_c0_g1_i6.p1 TRINITY_DN49784_c0_g1~~TRINITY_DN49784_c0_g1_i6.p1  ORF type:complete len:107 (-),score=7.72 TRINITY_DN49784_c0_g1_i6:107-427(-)
MLELTTEEEFHTHVKDGYVPDRLIVLDFYAAWCGPCKIIAPKVQVMETEYPDVSFYKIDVDILSDLTDKLSIEAMPTFLFWKNGAVIETFIGANHKHLSELICKHK